MRRLVTVLIVLALVVIGAGFYRGWFALSNPSTLPGSNKVDVQLTVDKDKIHEDADAVKKSTTDFTESVTGGNKQPAERPTENVRPTNP